MITGQQRDQEAVCLVEPDYHLHDLDLDQGTLTFLHADREALRNSTFLDQRMTGAGGEVVKVSLASAIRQLSFPVADSPAVRYIFHTAFCCSTLLARCLDLPPASHALREPAVFLKLAGLRRTGHPGINRPDQWRTLLAMSTSLLNRSFETGEVTVIKPTNAANNLITDLMDLPTTGPVLLLYSGLEQFLVSVIRKGERCRAFVRRLFNNLLMDSQRLAHIPDRKLLELTDLQVAAMVWHMQIENYLDVLATFPAMAIRTLDCDSLLAEPTATLRALYDFFDLTVDDSAVEKVVRGPAFTEYSKDSETAYDASRRESDYEETARIHRESLDNILAWSESLRTRRPVQVPLPRPLR